MAHRSRAALLAVLAILLCGKAVRCASSAPARAPLLLMQMLGGGNLGSGPTLTPSTAQQYKVLQTLGMNSGRVNLYPGAYLRGLDWDRPDTSNLEATLLAAHSVQVQPVLLFEYYSRFLNTTGLGTEAQWQQLGAVFAARFRPNGTFWREHGGDEYFGISVYTAFNEPDDSTGFCPGRAPGPAPYLAALRGLAAGVHSVDPSLIVAPGGFMRANAASDYQLCGLGPLLAPLYNSGVLDALDLHTYFDVNWAPMHGTYAHSAQSNFESVKKASGITRDINFLATEFNYKHRNVTEAQAAAGLVTALFDHAAVVGADGRTRVALLALPWNLFHTTAEDANYGLAQTFLPAYSPSLAGSALWRMANLTRGQVFVSVDPHATGVTLLSDPKNLWFHTIWQNLKHWSTLAGTTFTLDATHIPVTCTKVVAYNWAGELQTQDVGPNRTCTFTNLPVEQTIVFSASVFT